MSDIRNTYNQNVKYYLISEGLEPFELDTTLGWRDDKLKLSRDEKYHGIFLAFSGVLKFYDEAADYIERSYKLKGVNTLLYLVKSVLKEVNSEVKWVNDYSSLALADFKTKENDDGIVSIEFTANNLSELINSHESDEFEIGRLTDIDGSTIDPLIDNRMTLSGRNILLRGESIANLDENYTPLDEFFGLTPLSELVTSGGLDRMSAVYTWQLSDETPWSASNMFFTPQIDDPTLDNIQILNVDYDFSFRWRSRGTAGTNLPIQVRLFRMKYNGDGSYDIAEDTMIINTLEDGVIKASGSIQVENLAYDEGLAIYVSVNSGKAYSFNVDKFDLICYLDQVTEPSKDLKFLFTHDVGERLTYILTGQKETFYSKYFGRIEVVGETGNQVYANDGEMALIGNTSGLWARGFKEGSEKYKSMRFSLKDYLEDLKAVFNVGIGIDTIGFKERLRVEKLSYFYQQEVVVKLPIQISRPKRTLEEGLLFSGYSLGYEKGGDYESEIGLDEPNVKTNWTTPIRRSDTKFEKKSKTRGDDYGLELTRIKTQLDYPTEDTPRDESNWWLDLKRTEGSSYTQKSWDDRLEELPTGIHSPETFKGMLFTPLRILLRHGWTLKSGLMYFQDGFIRYASSYANSVLSMWFKGEDGALKENQDLPVSYLDRNNFDENVLEFEHPVDDELMDLILSKTSMAYEGSTENIPNYYFKFEWINEDSEIERGYLLDLDPGSGNGKFKMQIANESIN